MTITTVDKVNTPAVAASGDELYFQCLLSQGDKRTTGWIEARAAKKGRKVKLKDEGDQGAYWTVMYVYQPPRAGAWIREKQRMDRGSLKSIKGK